jgi:tyrosine decarboxylase/aspartate 1-decarboxylase
VNVATFNGPKKIPPPWRVSCTRKGHLRIVCMPHVHRDIIEKFIRDIGEIHA